MVCFLSLCVCTSTCKHREMLLLSECRALRNTGEDIRLPELFCRCFGMLGRWECRKSQADPTSVRFVDPDTLAPLSNCHHGRESHRLLEWSREQPTTSCHCKEHQCGRIRLLLLLNGRGGSLASSSSNLPYRCPPRKGRAERPIPKRGTRRTRQRSTLW